MHRLSGGNWPSIWTSLYSAPCSYSDAWCKTQLTTPGTYEFKLAACGDSSTNYCLSKTQSIVVNTPIDGTCGTANLGTFSSAADVNTAVLCATGTLNPTTIIGSGPWSWSCDGVNGGNNDSCSASLSSTPIDGTCGAANLGTFSSTTDVNTAGLCVAGTPNPTAVTNSGPWIWSCDGINGSNNSSACSADLSIPFGTPGIIFSMYFNGYEWQITPDTKTTGKFVLKLKSGTISYEIQNMELYNGKAKIGTITYDPAKKGYGFITIDPNVMKAAGFVGKLNSTNMIGFAIEGTELDPVIFNTAVKSKSTNAEQAQVIYDFKNSTGLTWVEIASLTGDKIEAADIEAFVTTNLAVINGTCGTANTGTFNSASEVNTAGLCATGNPDPATVTDPGLWIWVCKGVNSGSDSPACGANPIADCGNGSLDTGEQCDDGNIIAGDSCSATCQNEIVPGTTGGSSGSSGSTIGKIAIGAIGALGIAGALGALGSTGDGISSSIGKIATGAIDGVFGGLTGLATGAKTVVKSVMGGISDVTKALGLGDPFASAGTASGTVFDGPGAIIGLQQVFKPNYAGNTYGSAIGIITGWTNFLLPFVGAIAIAAIVYAGFLYLTAAGNDEQAGKAKKIIIWVVIGIIVIFSAYAIVNTLLGSSSGGGDNGTSISVGGLSVEF
jgi:cysteine-rich repeat protein